VTPSPARLLATCLALALPLAAGGCKWAGFLAQGVVPDMVEAQYPLKDRPTLVLVEQAEAPRPQAEPIDGATASMIRFSLEENEVLTDPIPFETLERVKRELGEAWGTTAIDRIGRMAGAAQVIHVRITSVRYQSDPGMLRPEATARVRLIDVDAGRRLFPSSERQDQAARDGHPVQVRLPPRHTLDHDRSALYTLSRTLARHLGAEVARLFYDHPVAEPGSFDRP